MAVLKGMSIGATVPVMELFAINAFEELEPLLHPADGQMLFLERKEGYAGAPLRRPERCSSFAVKRPRGRRSSRTTSTGSPATRQRRRGRRHPERPARPGGLTHGRVLPAGRRHEQSRRRAGHRVAHRLGRPGRRAARARLAVLARVEGPGRTRSLGRRCPGGPAATATRSRSPAGSALVVETTAESIAVLAGPARPHQPLPGPGARAARRRRRREGSSARHARLVELVDERKPSTVPEVMDMMRDQRRSAAGDLPPPGPGRRRRGVGGHVLHGGRRSRADGCGSRRGTRADRVRGDRPRRTSDDQARCLPTAGPTGPCYTDPIRTARSNEQAGRPTANRARFARATARGALEEKAAEGATMAREQKARSGRGADALVGAIAARHVHAGRDGTGDREHDDERVVFTWADTAEPSSLNPMVGVPGTRLLLLDTRAMTCRSTSTPTSERNSRASIRRLRLRVW